MRKTSTSIWFYLFLVAALMAFYSGTAYSCVTTCPTSGSSNSLQQWLATCHLCPDFTVSAEVCNGEYSITVSSSRSGSLVTYSYSITRPWGTKDLSHFVVELANVTCLATNLASLVTSASITVPGTGSGPVTYTVVPSVGSDPTTGLTGMKIELTAQQQSQWPQNKTATLRFTLDENALQAGYQLALGGCSVVGTKNDGQDIRYWGVPSPGYACIAGPLCVAPSLVELTTFKAVGNARQVLVQWRTEAELDNVGFHVWRSETAEGEYKKITKSVIPAEGSATASASYSYRDLDVVRGQTYYYRLEDIDSAGMSTFHGPVPGTTGFVRPISPENHEIITTGEPPVFTWSSSGFEMFRIQICKRAGFKSRILTLPLASARVINSDNAPWIHDLQYTPTAQEWTRIQSFAGESGVVYWRVIGKGKLAGESPSRSHGVKLQ